MENQDFQIKFEKILLFFVVYTLLFLIFFKTLRYTLPFVLAFLFASILKYPTRFLVTHLKIKNSLASIITTIIFFLVIITLATFLVLSLTSEVIDFSKYLQKLLSNNSSTLYNYFNNLQTSFLNFNFNIDKSILDSINTALSNSLKSFLSGAINITTSIVQGLFTFLSYVPYVVMTIIFTLLSTYFFTKEVSNKSSKRFLERNLPGNSSLKLFEIIYHSRKMIFNYCASLLFLITVSTLVTFIGFVLLGIDYSLMLSILAGLLDLLPIVGTILVYLPLVIINFASGKYFVAISLIALYVLVMVVRQLLEPKIMSSSLGINPVATLAALFIGLQVGGFGGVIFCMALLVFYNILKKVEVL